MLLPFHAFVSAMSVILLTVHVSLSFKLEGFLLFPFLFQPVLVSVLAVLEALLPVHASVSAIPEVLLAQCVSVSAMLEYL